jgi:hypothetical protein
MILELKELPHLTFKRKDNYHEFIHNRKYIQIYKQRVHTIVHIVIYRELNESNLTYIHFSLHKEIKRYITDNLPYCEYYEIISKKNEIQNAMELIAINLIIQTILGDIHFNYLNV